ncbi:MAG TPA: phosphoribosylanthranilate isomerase [Pyrinomonadaceae bacterium]
MTLVKICGITNLDDARAAVEAGADVLGFNFYQPSPRYISPEEARTIIDRLSSEVLTVGVFVNEPSPKDVLRIAKEAGVKGLQLHGDESTAYCEALAEHYVIKVFSVATGFIDEQVQRYRVPAVMLDAGDRKVRGGTGRVVDWSVAASFRESVPRLFLAGGLSPQNVSEAIETVKPYAVDACSLLENSPRQKNHELIRAFVTHAHRVKP